MINKLNSSKSQDILQNSTLKEEILIKSLIDEIFNAEEKISQINNMKDFSQNGQNLNNKKLFELKSLQNDLQQKLIILNNNYQTELSSKNNQIISQQKLLNDLDSSIKENQTKLLSFNTINFKSPLLSKYVLDNNINNKILTQEQINDILFKDKNRNEDELKQIIREIEINKASESVIMNNKNEITKKLNQVNENLRMIKEEKLSINDELIDIISFKESLEYMNKNNIYNLINNIKTNKSNNMNDFNSDDFPIKLYLYELEIINPNKAANKIYEELSDAFRIIGNYNNKNYRVNCMINEMRNINKIKNNTNTDFYPNSSNKNKNMNTIDIFDSKNNITNKDNYYNDISRTASYRNKSFNNSCIGVFNENTLLLDKNSLKNLIKEEIHSFITNNKNVFKYRNNSYENDDSLLIKNFLNKIASIIIKQLIKNENDISNSNFNCQNDLIIYLLYFFKIFYYDKIIENKFKFINKEYKTQKKEYKKIKEIISNELLKLENKYDEIKAKQIYNEKQLNSLKNSYENELQKNDNYTNLSQNEQSYIQICIKINSILKQKEEIKNTINNYEIDINNEQYKKENEIKNINNDLERIKKQINEINHKNELDTLKNNENIIIYRKLIADKFNIIKEQLQLYKEKYGSNLSLYNKFINNINNSIQKTYSKPFFDLEQNKIELFNYDSINIKNNNGIIINGGENKNNIDKFINLSINKNLNIINSLNSNNNNNLRNITERFYSNHSFNKSMNENDKEEDNDINKSVNNFLNKTMANMHQSSDYNLLSNDLFLGDSKNHNIINNIKVEKINQSFYQYPSSFSSKNKREKKEISHKKSNTSNNTTSNFDIFNKDLFNLNKFIKNSKEEERRKKREYNKENSDGNSKTFSHPFFRKQSKSQGGITEIGIIQNQTKTTKNNILNINLFRHKKNSSNSGNLRGGIPRGSKIINEQNIKNSIKNIKSRLDNNNNFLYKLNPLTKITFCYYREIASNSNNYIKYNPLKNISSKELCEYPYNFIKSTISLNKNYRSIKIVPSTQLEPIDFKIWMVENTVVSSAVKTIIDIHRSYYKWKENNKGNNVLNNFIDEQLQKFNNLSQADIEKCILNKNFNFSIIINNSDKEKNNNKRIEFVICSYDEFKMWINGMAFIIKNKMNILKMMNEKIN